MVSSQANRGTAQSGLSPGHPAATSCSSNEPLPLLRAGIQRIAGLLPTVDTAVENRDVGESLLLELLRLTDGGRVVRSTAVEDDLLIPGERARARAEVIQSDGAPELVCATFRVIGVRAHQQQIGSGPDAAPDVLRTDTFRFGHDLPPVREQRLIHSSLIVAQNRRP